MVSFVEDILRVSTVTGGPHALAHVTGGIDKIRDASTSQDGLATPAQIGRLEAAQNTLIASDADVQINAITSPSGVLFNQTLTLTANRLVRVHLAAGFGRQYVVLHQSPSPFLISVQNENPSSPGSFLSVASTVVSGQTLIFRIRNDGIAEIIYHGSSLAGSGGGGGLAATSIITGAHTAQPNTLVLTDSSGGGFQVTLPGAPGHGDAVGFLDVAPPESGWAFNTVTILRNGKSIGGVFDDILLDQDVRRLDLVFVAADNDWVASYTATTTAPAAAAAATVVSIPLTNDTDAALAHVGPDRVLATDVGTPVTLTLRAFATVPIPLYSVINLDRRGTGDFIVAPGSGVTLLKPADRQARLRTAESSAVLHHDPLNTWRLRGDLLEV